MAKVSKFGEGLRKLRKEKGITQRELAEAVNVASSSIAFYETGGRTPSLEVAEALSDYFGVTLTGLLDAHKEPPQSPLASVISGHNMDTRLSDTGPELTVTIRTSKLTLVLTGNDWVDVSYTKGDAHGGFRL